MHNQSCIRLLAVVRDLRDPSHQGRPCEASVLRAVQGLPTTFFGQGRSRSRKARNTKEFFLRSQGPKKGHVCGRPRPNWYACILMHSTGRNLLLVVAFVDLRVLRRASKLQTKYKQHLRDAKLGASYCTSNLLTLRVAWLTIKTFKTW